MRKRANPNAANTVVSIDRLAHDRASSVGRMDCRIRTDEAGRRIRHIAATQLGQAERLVVERWVAQAADPARLDEVAAELQVSRDRIYQLAASAKRKIISALIVQGFARQHVAAAIQAMRFRDYRNDRLCGRCEHALD